MSLLAIGWRRGPLTEGVAMGDRMNPTVELYDLLADRVRRDLERGLDEEEVRVKWGEVAWQLYLNRRHLPRPF